MNNKKAFTLVELIVTITILAILWTIAFISLWSFTMDSRDWRRISDIKIIEKWLELSLIDTWELPAPDNSVDINYSWWVLWKQWTFWNEVYKKIWKLSNVPKDPLWWNEYTYSISSNKRSYNLAYVQESDILSFGIIPKTYANEYISRVSWTYNWQIINTMTWWINYIFSSPSIIVSNLINPDILAMDWKIVFNRETNIPSSYSWLVNSVWNFNFTPVMVYSWTYLPQTPAQLKILIEKLQDSITWTKLYSHPSYKNLLEIDTSNSNDLYTYWINMINKSLWWRFLLNYPKSCKEILNSEDNKWNWEYTISPDWAKKINVYCDMTTDWGWWTRIRKWDKNAWLVEWSNINDTKWITWTEVMVTYERYWKIRKNVSWSWVDVDLSWKKYWYQYKRFKTKQTQESWLCWEYTKISELIGHLTSWSWGNCSRSCQRTELNNPASPCDSSLEYIDILIDDLWTNIWITNDKQLTWFEKDYCINNWHKTDTRNVSWNTNWYIEHRIDWTTSLINLSWDESRCDWIYWSASWLNDRVNEDSNYLINKWINNASDYVSWFQTVETWVK